MPVTTGNIIGTVPEELLKSRTPIKSAARKAFNGASGANEFLKAANDMWGISTLSPGALELLAAYVKLDKSKAIREAGDKQSGKPKRDLIKMILEDGEEIQWIRTYTEDGPVEQITGSAKTPRGAEAMLVAALVRGMGPDLKIDGSAKERQMLWEAAQRLNAQHANNPNFQPIVITNYTPVGQTPMMRQEQQEPAQKAAAASKFMQPAPEQKAAPRRAPAPKGPQLQPK